MPEEKGHGRLQQTPEHLLLKRPDVVSGYHQDCPSHKTTLRRSHTEPDVDEQ